MLRRDLASWAQDLNAKLNGAVSSAIPQQVVFDSRAIRLGDLFVALQTGSVTAMNLLSRPLRLAR